MAFERVAPFPYPFHDLSRKLLVLGFNRLEVASKVSHRFCEGLFYLCYFVTKFRGDARYFLFFFGHYFFPFLAPFLPLRASLYAIATASFGACPLPFLS